MRSNEDAHDYRYVPVRLAAVDVTDDGSRKSKIKARTLHEHYKKIRIRDFG